MQEPSLSRKRRRLLCRCLGNEHGSTCLEYLEKHFGTHLPVFQGKAGSYDPLDAMRRDAYREVFLYIRYQLQVAIEEKNNSDEREWEDDLNNEEL